MKFRNRVPYLAAIVATIMLVLLSSPVRALDLHQLVQGVHIYLGVVPAAIVRTHPAGHPERQMHDGRFDRDDEVHVLITLIDSSTGERITDAELEASVGEVGFSPQTKPLERMSINDTISYGNYYRMNGSAYYRIEVAARIPGRQTPLAAQFAYRLP